MTVLAEVGDLTRFDSPRELMSFLDLVPSEHTSGGRRRRWGITKTGNGRVRRVLVEAAGEANSTSTSSSSSVNSGAPSLPARKKLPTCSARWRIAMPATPRASQNDRAWAISAAEP